MTSPAPDLALEALFTSTAAGFGVPASAVQRAIRRVIDGRPLGALAERADVLEAFGVSTAAELPTAAPLEVDLLSGIRTGKSQLAACRGLHASQTVDVSHLSPGEVPRVSVLSLDLDKARVVLDHLVGTMMARPVLRALFAEPPTGDVVLVKHPCGRPVEIACVAGQRAGASVVARWSAGVIFDEYPKMLGELGGAIVNYDHARRAALGRLLPGAGILSIGSPWAPMGPAFERFSSRFGAPTAEHMVIRARADAMNPAWWTMERIDRLRRSDETAYRTDVLAEFADPSEAFIPATEIKAATRAEPLVLPPRSGRRYVCAIDPATRGNAWTLVILSGYLDAENVARFEVVLTREWQGSSIAPLSPARVLGEIASIVAPYGSPPVSTDQHSADALRDLAIRVGLRLCVLPITTANRSTLFETLKGALATRTLELAPDRALAADIASVRRRLTQAGIAYDLPRTRDGRHADYVPALLLALNAMPNAEQARLAAALRRRDERDEYMMNAWGFGEGPPILEHVDPKRRREILFDLADGRPLDRALESVWTRIARANGNHPGEAA